MHCYRIKDWEKYYETSETRKLKRMTWIPVQNKHDGKGFRRIMRRADGLEILGAFLVILEVASRCPQRGLLEDQDGPLGPQEISDKTGAPESALEKAFEVLVSKEIGWIEMVGSAAIPADSPAIPAGDPGTPGTNRREWTGMEGNGQTRKSSFCANVERFIEEYPKEVNDLASQTFLSVVTTPSEEELLFKNLRLYKATDQWIRGIVPAAKTWLSEGSWKVAPKNPAQQSETPFWKEPV